MSPRRHQRRDEVTPLDLERAQRVDTVQTWSDGDWLVRTIPGGAATKTYRCPGCSQSIPPATPHVVVWPAEPSSWVVDSPVAERRHWHTGCWNRRR